MSGSMLGPDIQTVSQGVLSSGSRGSFMEQKAGVLGALTLVPSVGFERTGGRPNFHDHSAGVGLVSAVYRALGIKW